MVAAPANHSVAVELQVATGDAELPGGAEWSHWAGTALAAGNYGSVTRMTVRLVGRDESRRLNKDYRHTDAATNVLAFPGTELHAMITDEERELGDLIICLPIVYVEAQQQRKQPLAHLAHLVVHGTLHLIGFDHQDDINAERMEQLETKVMRQLDFPDPYIESQTICGVTDNE